MTEWGAMKERFCAEFPGARNPKYFRAPGRVNLIGEHTDYNGLPVLPMTLAQEVRAVAEPRKDSLIVLRSSDPAFPPAEFVNDDNITPSEMGAWENYTKAAVAGLNAFFKPKKRPGMSLLMGGNLPMRAGLSSSSAVVVTAALVYLDALGLELEQDISRLRLASLLAEAEHFVGTRGGGMDQAVILNGDEGHACKIDFFPLRVENAPLPQDCAVVVCDSTVKADKSGSARLRYNMNPRLCQLGCALVRMQLCRDIGEDVELDRLGDLWFGALCLTTREAERLFTQSVPDGAVKLPQIAKMLHMKPEAVMQRWLDGVPEVNGGYEILPRLCHQAGEYRRVETARDALVAEDSTALGGLMNDSHASCRDNLKISTPELEKLVEVAREAGALGSRLTGAGFGGATVSLVPANRVERFMETIARRYYRDFLNLDGEPPMFIARTSPAAGFVNLG